METSLNSCPYCGEEPVSRGEGVVMCNNTKELCQNRASVFTLAAWNRRFVCLDKHGDKVYSDSIVHISAARTGYRSDRYSIAWDKTYLHWHFHPLDGGYIETVFTNNVSVDDIELVKEAP